VKEGAVVVGRIHKATPHGHVYGVGARPVVGAVFGGAGQMHGGAALPRGHHTFAEFVFVHVGRVCRLVDLRQLEAVVRSTLNTV
jgi:hypothetical protein